MEPELEPVPPQVKKRKAPVPGIRIPKSIRVGAQEYKIKMVKTLESEGEPAHGMLDDDACEIILVKGMSRSKAQEILLHEILHALFYRLPHKPDIMTEEEFVGHTAPRLLMVLRDNPSLLLYLTQPT